MAKRTDKLWRDRLKARRDIYPFPKFKRECALLTEDLLFGEIYIAENLVNGKQYCGKSEYCAEWRWCKGKCGHVYQAINGSDDHFHRALRKHGSAEQFYLDGFSVVVIFHAKSKDELNQMERQVIAERDLMNHEKGYNSREGGEGGTPTDVVRGKLKKSGKSYWDSLTEEEREERLDNGMRKASKISVERRTDTTEDGLKKPIWDFIPKETQERLSMEQSNRMKEKIANMTEEEFEKHMSNLAPPRSAEEMSQISAEYHKRLKTDSDEKMRWRAALRFAKNPIDPKTDISDFFSEK